MKYEELKPLLKWRANDLRFLLSDVETPEFLAEILSVDGLPYDEIPERHYERVVAFRKRRQDQRVALCRRFLEGKKLERDW